MGDQDDWSLSSDQRRSTVARVAANISSIAFSKGQQLSDADAERAAENAERKAYTVARVEAKTTTGLRPHSETYEAYTRQVPKLCSQCQTVLIITASACMQEACLLGVGSNK